MFVFVHVMQLLKIKFKRIILCKGSTYAKRRAMARNKWIFSIFAPHSPPYPPIGRLFALDRERREPLQYIAQTLPTKFCAPLRRGARAQWSAKVPHRPHHRNHRETYCNLRALFCNHRGLICAPLPPIARFGAKNFPAFPGHAAQRRAMTPISSARWLQ